MHKSEKCTGEGTPTLALKPMGKFNVSSRQRAPQNSDLLQKNQDPG